MTEANKTPFIYEFIAGSVGGAAQVLSGQPFDIVKVRMQSGNNDGALKILKNILTNEGGIFALWKGTLSPLLGVGGAVSIQFGVNENVKKFFDHYNQGAKISTIQLMISGALAGVANCLVTIPAEHTRIRMQIQSQTNPIYTGSIDCMRKILAEYGIKGLFKGGVSTIYRDAIGYAGFFGMYAYSSQMVLNPGQRREDLSVLQISIAGMMAGIAYWTPCYPFDIVKTKIQTDSFSNPIFKNTWDCFAQVYRQNGIGGFTKGFVPCILRTLPAAACTFNGFEFAMKMIKKLDSKKEVSM